MNSNVDVNKNKNKSKNKIAFTIVFIMLVIITISFVSYSAYEKEDILHFLSNVPVEVDKKYDFEFEIELADSMGNNRKTVAFIPKVNYEDPVIECDNGDSSGIIYDKENYMFTINRNIKGKCTAVFKLKSDADSSLDSSLTSYRLFINDNKKGYYLASSLKDNVKYVINEKKTFSKENDKSYIGNCDINTKLIGIKPDNIIYFLTNDSNSCDIYVDFLLDDSNSNFEFDYTGSEQIFNVSKDGYYLIEAWAGETDENNLGNYSKGIYYLNKSNLIINVGGMKNLDNPGYNGGATHISLESGLLSDDNFNKDSLIIASFSGSDTFVDNFGGYVGNANYSEIVSYSNESVCISDVATSNCVKRGNGFIKITYLYGNLLNN